MINFAIGLPLTSRGTPHWRDNVAAFAKSLAATTATETDSVAVNVFLGIDEDDAALCSEEEGDGDDGKWLPRRILLDCSPLSPVSVHTVVFDTDVASRVPTTPAFHPAIVAKGAVCVMWRKLAVAAFDAGADYFVLLGDDVVLHTPRWASAVDRAFGEIAARLQVVKGFGCVALFDRAFPGFPTMPVMSRTHFEIFGRRFMPSPMVNQDGDPFLFALYRRWKASVLLDGGTAALTNGIGGDGEARYEQTYAEGWAFDLLDEYVAETDLWLQTNAPEAAAKRALTIDIVVPSYRVIPEMMDGFVAAVDDAPSDVDASLIVIVDDPKAVDSVASVCRKYDHRADFKLRVNSANMGASGARNRGMEESSADWIVFLDDDVVPAPGLLAAYRDAMQRFPRAAGFVGLADFPDARDTFWAQAVHLSDVTYFWGVADMMRNDDADVPWGVTANLAVRRLRDGVTFDQAFPRTGGGEDIAFCVDKTEAHKNAVLGGTGFRAVADARVVHPYWDDGRPKFKRFFGWADGDALLLERYPELTYRAAPNAAELALLVCIASLASLAFDFAIGGKLAALTLPVLLVTHVGYYTFKALTSTAENRGWEAAGRPDGLRLLAVGAASSLIRLASDLGHLWSALRRGRPTEICLRFHWWIHMNQHCKEDEKGEARKRLAVHIAALVLAVGMFG